MTIELHTLSADKKAKKSKRRIGRGYGSSKGGHTVGRGQKGQKSRAGASGFKKRGIRRLILSTPKLRGFKSPNTSVETVNLSAIDEKFIKGEVITLKTLLKKGLVSTDKNGVKILGNGDITKSVTVKKCSISKSAAEKIVAAGGKIEA